MSHRSLSEHQTARHASHGPVRRANWACLSNQLEETIASGLDFYCLEGILESIDDGIVLLNSHRKITFTNGAARQLLGDRLGEFLASDWATRFEA